MTTEDPKDSNAGETRETASYAPPAFPPPSAPPTAAGAGYQPPPAPPTGPYAAAPRPAKRGVPKWLWWVLGGGMVLLLAAVVLVVLLLSGASSNDAKGTATSYVDALAQGDTQTANEIARTKGDKRLVVLESDALAEAQPATDYRITSFREADGDAYAEVSFKVDGSTVAGYLSLQQDEEGWYVNDGLTSPLPPTFGIFGDAGYRIAGFDGVVDDSMQLEAYPGTYEALSPSEYLEFDTPWSIEIGPPVASVDSPQLIASQAYLDYVEDYLKTAIDDCIADVKNTLSPSCGFYVYPTKVFRGEVTKIAVAEYPTVKHGEYGGVEIDSPGSLTVTWKGKGIIGDKTITEKEKSTFSSLSMSTGFQDGKPTVTVY